MNDIYKRCLNCGENLNHTEGKREKVFCDTTCRSNYWQKSERLEKKGFTAEQIISAITKTWKKGKEKTTVQVLNEVAKRMGTVAVAVKSDPPIIKPADYPEKNKGESGIDYSIRLAEWKEKQA